MTISITGCSTGIGRATAGVLRRELTLDGVSVSLVEPGPISAPMPNGVPAMVEEASRTLPLEAIEHAMESPRPKTRYLVTTDAKSAALTRWLLPDRLFDRAAAMMA